MDVDNVKIIDSTHGLSSVLQMAKEQENTDPTVNVEREVAEVEGDAGIESGTTIDNAYEDDDVLDDGTLEMGELRSNESIEADDADEDAQDVEDDDDDIEDDDDGDDEGIEVADDDDLDVEELLSNESDGVAVFSELNTSASAVLTNDCKSWCQEDRSKQGHRHCAPGDMAHLCGSCSYCRSPARRRRSSSGSPARRRRSSTGGGICKSWCKDDRSKQGHRHCAPGDMANSCGGCSYCKSSSPRRRRTSSTVRRRRTSSTTRRRRSSSTCNVKSIDSSSIWRHETSAHSCRGSYKKDGSGMCAGDPTSIVMDMRKVSKKQGCYAWKTRGCSFSMKELVRMEFDVEWNDCKDIWFAPLWLYSDPWRKPQGLSGEIDLLETCRSHNGQITTSIICRDHPHPDCYEPKWGDARGGKGHFVGKILSDGTWTMTRDGKLVSRYPQYIHKIHSYKHGRNDPFHFMTDIWNGGAGDDGWKYCGILNHNTQCRFKVRNIKLTLKGNRKLSGRCSAMTRR